MKSKSPSIAIRLMGLDDIPIVAEWMATIPLWQRYGLTEEKAIQQFHQARTGEDLIIVADIDAERLACGFAWCIRDGAFGRSPYLRLIGVHPQYNGMGIGKALLDHIENACRETFSDLFLLVSDFNTDAQFFYRRSGYEQVGAIPGYVVPDVTELLFRKHLQ